MGLIPHGVCNIIEDQFARLLWAHLKLSPRTSIVSSHLGQGTAYIGGGEARGGSSSCMGGDRPLFVRMDRRNSQDRRARTCTSASRSCPAGGTVSALASMRE